MEAWQKVFGGVQKSEFFACKGMFGEKLFNGKKILFFWTLSEVFVIFGENFWQVCQNCIRRDYTNISRKSFQRQKSLLPFMEFIRNPLWHWQKLFVLVDNFAFFTPRQQFLLQEFSLKICKFAVGFPQWMKKLWPLNENFFKSVVKITFWLSRGTQRDSKFKRKDNLIATFCVLSKFSEPMLKINCMRFSRLHSICPSEQICENMFERKITLFLTLQNLSEGFQFWQKNTFHQVSHFWTLRVRRTFWGKTPSWKRITFSNIWTSREQIAAKFFSECIVGAEFYMSKGALRSKSFH